MRNSYVTVKMTFLHLLRYEFMKHLSVLEKDIPPWTQLSMVRLSMTLNLINSSLCALKYECLNGFWVLIRICRCVTLHDELLNKIKCVPCKHGAFTSIWWCYEWCELLYYSLKVLVWLNCSKCHSRKKVSKWGIL